MKNYKGIEKVIVFGQSEIVNKRMPLFTIQQRYKYYISCCIFLYMCVFFLVRIYPSALLSECVFFLMRLYTYAFFPVRFFPMRFFPMRFFPVRFFNSGHHNSVTHVHIYWHSRAHSSYSSIHWLHYYWNIIEQLFQLTDFSHRREKHARPSADIQTTCSIHTKQVFHATGISLLMSSVCLLKTRRENRARLYLTMYFDGISHTGVFFTPSLRYDNVCPKCPSIYYFIPVI